MRNTGNYSIEIFNSLGDLVFDDCLNLKKHLHIGGTVYVMMDIKLVVNIYLYH